MSGKNFSINFCGLRILILMLVFSGCARPNFRDPVVVSQIANDNKTQEPGGEARCDRLCDLTFSPLSIYGTISWVNLPQGNQFGEFLLKFWNGGEPVAPGSDQAEVSVKLWMPSMGHGSSPVKVERVALGSYRATRVYFIMPGEWQLVIQVHYEGRLLAEAIQNIII